MIIEKNLLILLAKRDGRCFEKTDGNCTAMCGWISGRWGHSQFFGEVWFEGRRNGCRSGRNVQSHRTLQAGGRFEHVQDEKRLLRGRR